jgi:hypothetical protein
MLYIYTVTLVEGEFKAMFAGSQGPVVEGYCSARRWKCKELA